MEKLNDINFNIFTLDDKEKYIIPLYIFNNNYDKICDMLLIRKVIDNTIRYHYVLITNLAKLLSSQNKLHRKVSYCRRCLQHFYTIEKLNDHMIYCNKIDPQKTIFPLKANRFINFKTLKIKYQFHL